MDEAKYLRERDEAERRQAAPWATFIIELVTCEVCGERLPGGRMQSHAQHHGCRALQGGRVGTFPTHGVPVSEDLGAKLDVARCTRRVQVATTITFWATPGGCMDPIEVRGNERGWHEYQPGFNGWRVHFGADGLASSMSWSPPVQVPIGHVSVKPGGPVLGPCPGHLQPVGQGHTHRGTVWRWEGCTVCGHVTKVRDREPLQESLL